MSNHTTLCANVLCANSGKMNGLVLETKNDSNTGSITSTTDSVPLLTVKNTNTDGGSGSVIQLKSHPSDNVQSDFDDVGLISFVGLDDAGSLNEYASIRCIAADSAAGAEISIVQFNVSKAGARNLVLQLETPDSTAPSASIYGDLRLMGGLYTALATVTASGTAVALTSDVVQTVTSTNDSHKVKLPLAKGTGQLIFIKNIDNAQDVVIRNNADDTTLLTLGEGKTAIFISTLLGDNWGGSQID